MSEIYLQWTGTPVYLGENCRSKPIYAQTAEFVPGETLECSPPYIRGKLDNKWVRWSEGNKPSQYSKEDCEAVIGMPLLPIPSA